MIPEWIKTSERGKRIEMGLKKERLSHDNPIFN